MDYSFASKIFGLLIINLLEMLIYAIQDVTIE